MKYKATYGYWPNHLRIQTINVPFHVVIPSLKPRNLSEFLTELCGLRETWFWNRRHRQFCWVSYIFQCNWWIFLWNKSLSNYIPLIFISKRSCIFSTLFFKNRIILSLRSWKEKYCKVLLYGLHGERNIKLVSLCITCQYSDMLQR